MRHCHVTTPGTLFDVALPEGFLYRDAFISDIEEQQLTVAIEHVEFAPFEMRGVVARRRVAFFGRTYGAEAAAAPPIPEFLHALRRRAADWIGLPEDAFVMALVNEYSPGAPIGWHRDAPQYGVVVGVSLLSPCRMVFRPYVSPANAAGMRTTRRATHAIRLEPRSAYLISGTARSDYEHHIPAVKAPRYSVTFRTLRR